MITDTSLLGFIINAGVVVKCVMLILLLASAFSWMFMLQRHWRYREVKRQSQQLHQHLLQGGDLTELFQQYQHQTSDGQVAMLQCAYQTWQQLNATRASREAILQQVERAMQISASQSLGELQQHLGFIATVGSTSPYIGLFGTVWGIMTAFTQISGLGQATLATVAPGIAEALIATAFGLFAAIPAVIGYNRFQGQLEQFDQQYQSFADTILNRLETHLWITGEA